MSCNPCLPSWQQSCHWSARWSMHNLLPLGVSAGALLLEHHEEGLIFSEGAIGVVKIPLGLCELLVSVGELLSLGLRLLLACDLIFLGGLELLICLHVGGLILLSLSQVLFEALLNVSSCNVTIQPRLQILQP